MSFFALLHLSAINRTSILRTWKRPAYFSFLLHIRKKQWSSTTILLISIAYDSVPRFFDLKFEKTALDMSFPNFRYLDSSSSLVPILWHLSAPRSSWQVSFVCFPTWRYSNTMTSSSEVGHLAISHLGCWSEYLVTAKCWCLCRSFEVGFCMIEMTHLISSRERQINIEGQQKRGFDSTIGFGSFKMVGR